MGPDVWRPPIIESVIPVNLLDLPPNTYRSEESEGEETEESEGGETGGSCEEEGSGPKRCPLSRSYIQWYNFMVDCEVERFGLAWSQIRRDNIVEWVLHGTIEDTPNLEQISGRAGIPGAAVRSIWKPFSCKTPILD